MNSSSSRRTVRKRFDVFDVQFVPATPDGDYEFEPSVDWSRVSEIREVNAAEPWPFNGIKLNVDFCTIPKIREMLENPGMKISS